MSFERLGLRLNKIFTGILCDLLDTSLEDWSFSQSEVPHNLSLDYNVKCIYLLIQFLNVVLKPFWRQEANLRLRRDLSRIVVFTKNVCRFELVLGWIGGDHEVQSGTRAMLELCEPMSNSLLSDEYNIVHFGLRRLARMDLSLVSIPKGLVQLELDISLYIRHSLSNYPIWDLD